MVDRTLDTLAEFHLQNPDDSAYALIAHMINVLETHDEEGMEHMQRNISNILSEVPASRILHVMCQIDHVDYLALLQDCQAITTYRVSPKLLLHLAVLPVPFVANKLQIDQYWATQLLDQFHKHFTIDEPILWLKRFLSITENERMRYSKAKEDLLMGRAVTGTPQDTAEYRRAHQYHHIKPDLKPKI